MAETKRYHVKIPDGLNLSHDTDYTAYSLISRGRDIDDLLSNVQVFALDYEDNEKAFHIEDLAPVDQDVVFELLKEALRG